MSDNNSLNPKVLLEGLYDILKNDGERLDEKAVSKSQQRFMGMVHAAQQGEKAASPEVAKVAKSMSKKDAKDFAQTKHKGLPEKVKKECGEPDVMADEELSMFNRHSLGKRGGRGQNDNPWNYLHKGKSRRHFKSRIAKYDNDMEECAGVGIITKQNSTKDVNKNTPQKNLDAFHLEEALRDMASSLIKETKLRKGTLKSIPNLETWAELDNNNSPYAAYRYGVALAGAPVDKMDKHGPVGGQFVTIGYTEEDRNILNHAAKTMGVSPKKHGSDKSEEMDHINTKSAIGPAKRNKYGI